MVFLTVKRTLRLIISGDVWESTARHTRGSGSRDVEISGLSGSLK